jgi:multisubunit Na+/H+ antiporter MnhG subunit
MTAHTLLTDTLLGTTVFSCWIGVFGMLRMHTPMQALHYLSVPASLGALALTLAVYCETGFSSATFKTGLTAAVLLCISSVVTHATARAFRTRELGHWEPRDGDPIEFVPKQQPSRSKQ